MSVTIYRSIILLSVGAALLSAGLSSVTGWLPSELRTYNEALSDVPITTTEAIGVAVGALSLVTGLIATVGLWRFRPWARRVAVIATVTGLIAGLGLGPVVQSVWAQFFYEFSSMLWGGVLATSYWSPLARRFTGTPAA